MSAECLMSSSGNLDPRMLARHKSARNLWRGKPANDKCDRKLILAPVPLGKALSGCKVDFEGAFYLALP